MRCMAAAARLAGDVAGIARELDAAVGPGRPRGAGEPAVAALTAQLSAAAGVPVVSTDVGSCRQLIEGLEPEDRALGACGRVVGIANPAALADAALELLQSPEAWQAASAAGIARVERYYSDHLLFDRYRQVYDRAMQHSEEYH